MSKVPLSALPVSTAATAQVARLFRRAGFGADRRTIDSWAARGYTATVDNLLSFLPSNQRPDHAEVLAWELVVANVSDASANSVSMVTLMRLWLDRMARSAYPLEEKLTLYWHDHFATAWTKVGLMYLMLHQHNKLRIEAAGQFPRLCDAMTTDGAMLVWLDGQTNIAAAPNENYGREFLELFTLGVNRYGQDDVVEASRAFTGWVPDGLGNATLDPALHDDAIKTILGQTGPWGATDVTQIVLNHRDGGEAVAAYHVSRRMATFFHHPDPEPELIDAMANAFVASGYQIKPMVRTMLLHPSFVEGAELTIKCPAELVAGAAKALQLNLKDDIGARVLTYDELSIAMVSMGQELFNPPSVAGWRGGAGWANSAATIARYNFALRASQLTADDVVGVTLDSVLGVARDTTRPWMDRLGMVSLLPQTAAAIDEYVTSARSAGLSADGVARGVLALLLASPDYNLR